MKGNEDQLQTGELVEQEEDDLEQNEEPRYIKKII